MRKVALHIPLILLALLAAPVPRSARAWSSAAPTPAAASAAAASPLVFKSVWHDVSRPLREVAREAGAPTRVADEAATPVAIGLPENPSDDALGVAIEPSPAREAGVQRTTGPFAMPATNVNFIGGSAFGVVPPSPSMDVGPNHCVVMCNLTTMIFDKAGTTLLGPVNNNSFWSGLGGDCETNNAGSPLVLYDQVQERWLLIQLSSFAGPTTSMCLAVSKTPDPTGEYFRWSIPLGDRIFDSPKAAVWRDGFYLGFRSFTSSGATEGNLVLALKRLDVVSGFPTLTAIGFLMPQSVAGAPALNGDGWLPADLDGTQMPPAGSPAYFVGSMDNGGPYGAVQDALTLWRFHADWATPVNSTFTLAATLPVSAFDSMYPCTGGQRRCIPQPAAPSSQWLDIQSYRQRVLNRVTYRNFGTHESIACNQSVETTGALGAIAGIRWYELRDPGGTPVVHQQGTYSPGTTDGIHRWNGALAMDHQGNMALGYSVSNVVDVFPGIRYTGRLAGDPLDAMSQGEGTVIEGTGIQTSTTNRWGDYSCMSVDPVDDCTFWYVNQYYPTNSIGSWRLRVGAFKFPGCESLVSVEDGAGLPSGTRLAPLGVVRGSVDVSFTLAGGASRRVQLEVLDVSGRRVRRLMNESLPGGRYHVGWDLRSDHGEPLRAGVYHVRLVAGDEQRVEGAILVR